MLSESRIILPRVPEAREVEPLLTDLAGGFTRMRAKGEWKDPTTGRVIREPVWIYLLSADWEGDESKAVALAQIAMAAATELKQQAVMVTYPWGSFFIAPGGMMPVTHASTTAMQ